MNDPQLPGKPDFVFSRSRIAVFVDGCFWHGCSRCKHPPKSNVAFWNLKVVVNQRRDKRVARALRFQGWTVLRLRECTLKNSRKTEAFLAGLEKLIQSSPGRKPVR